MIEDHADMYDAIKGYEVNNECIENETMCYLGIVWSARQRIELRRFSVHNGVIVNIWAIKILTHKFHSH